MKLRLLATLCAIALVWFVPASPVAASAAPFYYVSLGDSLAAGTQPGQFSTDEGYTDQLYADLHVQMPTLQHEKLACPGETTATMISGALPYEGRNPKEPCAYAHGSQLAEAASFLRGHRNFVALVTIDIGANDILNDPAHGGDAIAANLPVILATLRDSAGPDVPIIGMNYYDPRLALVWFTNPSGLAAEIAAAVGFNAFLGALYAAAQDPVADVATAFATTDTTLVADPTFGIVPVDVLRICQWTWVCTAQNIHANVVGYHVIALAFEAKL
jgi:lysophospholipase L1-like esterase